MIRYHVDAGTEPRRIDERRRAEIVGEGFVRSGAYVARMDGRDAFHGEVFANTDGTVAASLTATKLLGTNLALHSELEDGTYVLTEARPKRLFWLLGAGATIPVDGSSRLYPRADTFAALLAAHRAHVDDVARTRRSTPKAGVDVDRFAELRHREQQQRAGVDAFAGKIGTAVWMAAFAVFNGAAIGLSWVHARDRIWELVLVATIASLPAALAGRFFLGPAIAKARRLGLRAEPDAAAGDLTHVDVSRGGGKATYAMVAMTVAVVAALIAVSFSGGLAAHGWGLVAPVLALTNGVRVLLETRRSAKGETRKEALAIAGDRVTVAGEVIRRSDVRAALRTNDDGKEALLLLGARGAILRASGDRHVIDRIDAALRPKRTTLPTVHPFAPLVALFAAAALAFGARSGPLPGWTFGLALLAMFLSPLSWLVGRRVEIGADGILVGARFIGFSDVRAVRCKRETVTFELEDGAKVKVTFAHAGAAALVERALEDHRARGAARDDAAVVRRRVAIADSDDEPAPYRARVESPDELAEALLDSAEARSVRLRAARRLARDEGAEAARLREDVGERLVDPDVRAALGTDRDS